MLHANLKAVCSPQIATFSVVKLHFETFGLLDYDTQLYISIKPINQRVVDEGVAKLENCLTDIYTWMSQNKLKLNADKTEVLVMGTP